MKSIILNTRKISFNFLNKNIFLGMLLLFVSFSTQAQTKKNKNAKYTIEVNGNCELCKKRIEKASLSVKGVKTANWDVDTHQLSLIINENKCSIKDIEKAIADVGHDTNDLKAKDEVYNNLHQCCKYDRK